MSLTNEEKAKLYDDYVFESQQLQRANSKIKSEFAGNIPLHQQRVIDKNNELIEVLSKKLESLF